MIAYDILVTDVTCYGDLYCVAGWDLNRGGMIRPEPLGTNPSMEASRFWSAQYAGAGKLFSVGNIVQFNARKPPAASPYPHATEDRIVASQISCIGQIPVQHIPSKVAAGIAPTLSAAFGGQLHRVASGKGYVSAGQQTHSLGAIEIAPSKIQFYEENPSPGKRRLRAQLKQGVLLYDLSVPADAARSLFHSGGVAALTGHAQASMRLHVRVGLSRPFAAMPDKCYAQINGLYFL